MTSPDQPPAIQKKVCMLGGFAAGKTSLVRRFVFSLFDERYQTTVGVKIDKKMVNVESQTLTLMLWDFAGHDQFSHIRPAHMRGSSGAIFVLDRTRRKTLHTATALYRQFQEVIGNVPVVVAVNKSDLTTDVDLEIAAVNSAFENAALVLETSAKTGQGVEDLFYGLAHEMLQISHDIRPERD